jgi:hypothetical protein
VALNRPIVFSKTLITEIADSLPEPVCERRRELLPKILHEWSRTDLQMHLSRDPRPVVRARIKKIEGVVKCADRLLQAFKALDDVDRAIIEYEILRRVEGRDHVSQLERSNLRRRMGEKNELLAKLAAIAPTKLWGLGRGQPRDITAYLVLRDAAAIFKWFTDKKPTRRVDRASGTESGPFFEFASVLWPVLFGKGIQGLPAAMKNWAEAKSRYGAGSLVINNISRRYPAWRVFDC